jgi:hypothetical protein
VGVNGILVEIVNIQVLHLTVYELPVRRKKNQNFSRLEPTYPVLLVYYYSTGLPLYTFKSVSSARTRGGWGVDVGSSVNNSATTAVFGYTGA